jgi:hypothetical protein
MDNGENALVVQLLFRKKVVLEMERTLDPSMSNACQDRCITKERQSDSLDQNTSS